MLDRFYVPESLQTPSVTLAGTEARHLARVLRKQPGEEVTLFDGRGSEVRARIDSVDRHTVTLIPAGPPSHRPTTGCRVLLATAVPKGDRARWLVEKATELGAAGWIPLQTERSVVDPGRTKLEKMEQTVVAACKQSGRNDLMPVQQPRTWSELLNANDGDSSLLVADPGGTPVSEWLRSQSDSGQTSLTVAIGPEGGLTDEELAAAQARGAQMIGLGPSILRIETAAVAVLAAIRLHTGPP